MRIAESTLAGHPCDVLEPESPSPHGYTVIYLHGTGEARLSEKPVLLKEFDRRGLRVVGPQSGRSWWVDRISPHFDPHLTGERYVLDHVVPLIKERFHCEPPRLAIMGKSMGGQGALRLAYRYPDLFRVVAAIAPAIDFHNKWEEGDDTLRAMYESSEAARQDTAILYVHPLNYPRWQFFCCDPTDVRWWDSSDRLRMKLASLGVPFECYLETEGFGHGPAYTDAMASKTIAFVAESLEKERGRLV